MTWTAPTVRPPSATAGTVTFSAPSPQCAVVFPSVAEAGSTSTVPGVSAAYASDIRVSAARDAASPSASNSAMVRASRRTDSSVSPRSCAVRVNATGTVKAVRATATNRT